jgi:hypothetical protein
MTIKNPCNARIFPLNIYVVTIDQLQLREILGKNIPSVHTSKIFVSDAFYCMYTDDYITRDGHSKFIKWLYNRGIFKWKPSFDCDNYAESFRVYLQIIHSKAVSDSLISAERQSVAIGVVWYYKDGVGGHAINVYVTHDSTNSNALRFFEPQTGEIIILTEPELNSISFILI